MGKRPVLAGLALTVALVLAPLGFSAPPAQAGEVNGSPGPIPGAALAGGIGCAIQDAFGNPVTTIPVSRQDGGSAFWLVYQNDGQVDRRVTFIVAPSFPGSPLAGQRQIFRPNDACNIATPFGIPFWGLDRTAGPWALTVINDRGLSATCSFEVVP